VFGRGENPINFVSVQDVARAVEQAVVDRQYGSTLDVGGPQNLSLNRLVEIVAESHGRPAKSRHVPLAALRLGALALRPFRPDIAGLLQAAVLMDTADMSFDPAEVTACAPPRPMQLGEIARSDRGLPITS